MTYTFQRDNPVKTINVLHIDDEESHLMLTKHLLEKYEPTLNITSHTSVQRVLETDLTSFDCIISDYSMPNMTGIDLALHIKKKTTIPFILYTGKGSEEISSEAYASGIDSYQRKEPNVSHYQVLANRIKNLVEKNRAVADLRESWEISSELIDNFPSGLFIYQFVGPDQLILNWGNAQAEQMTGINLESSIGKEYLSIWSSKKGRALKNNLTYSILNKKPFKTEKFHFDENNKEGYLKLNAFLLSGDKIVVSFENITDRIIYETRLEALLNHIIEIDTVKTIREIAEIGFKLLKETLGFNSGRFYTRTRTGFTEISAQGEKEYQYNELDPSITNAFKSGSTTQIQDIENTGQNELFVPIKIDKVVEAVLCVRSKKASSVSKQDINLVEILALQLSSAIRRINEVDRLERLVAERTQKLLDNERLVTAGKIISMMGHDLRSPLQSIINSMYIIKNDKSQWEYFFPNIEDSACYAVKILEDLQHLTKEYPIRRFPTDIGYLINQSIESHRLPDNISVRSEIDRDIGTIEIDPIQIRRVVDNLISNAVDAMPQGGTITIKVKIVDNSLFISIADTGEGISPEIEPLLFELFNTTKPNGTGLGLAFCKRAVEAHGGEIKVDNNHKNGACFNVILPF